MPDYTVKQGDCIESIAQKYGLFGEKIWNHSNNAQLNERRHEGVDGNWHCPLSKCHHYTISMTYTDTDFIENHGKTRYKSTSFLKFKEEYSCNVSSCNRYFNHSNINL